MGTSTLLEWNREKDWRASIKNTLSELFEKKLKEERERRRKVRHKNYLVREREGMEQREQEWKYTEQKKRN